MAKAQIGVYGLGTMGSALALNMAEKGFEVAVTNRETQYIHCVGYGIDLRKIQVDPHTRSQAIISLHKAIIRH